MRNNDIELEIDQFGREARQPLILPIGPPVLDSDVLSHDIAERAQSLPECLITSCHRGRRGRRYEAYPVHFDLLRPHLMVRGQNSEAHCHHSDVFTDASAEMHYLSTAFRRARHDIFLRVNAARRAGDSANVSAILLRIAPFIAHHDALDEANDHRDIASPRFFRLCTQL